MGYYLNRELHDELVITGSKTNDDTLPEIEVFNNDSIYLKLEGIEVPVPEEIREVFTNPEAVSLIRVIIEWGDGEKTSLTPENYERSTSAIGTQYDSWLNNKHTYHFHEKVDKVNLKITLYNSINHKVVIDVPIKVRYKSLSELNVRYELVSANITNSNTVSYVINDASTKQMMVVGSLADDWTEDKSFYDKSKMWLEKDNNGTQSTSL